MSFLNKTALFLIYLRQKFFSSHTWIFKNVLYTQPVCSHHPHCSEYSKQCFQKYDFLTALKYTMERISKCTPDTKIKYDPSSYKVVFFSSSWIWVPYLKELLSDPRFDIVWVVTMPDVPSGRWQKIKPNVIAQELVDFVQDEKQEKVSDEIIDLVSQNKKIRLFKPSKIKKNQKFIEKLKELDPDYFVVISYWKILPKDVLDIPKFWPINIHWSILPKYRWASPIQSVFLNQEKETWISLMYMDEWMDTWDVIKILKFPLTKKDNAKTVIDKFVEFWPKFTNDTLWDFWKWKLKRIPQNHNKATYCKKFIKEDWKINFNESAEQIYRKWQAFYIWPGIYAYWNWKLIKFIDIDYEKQNKNISVKDKNISFWVVFEENWQVKVKCWNWNIILKKVKLEWKKEINIKEFINGHNNFVGSKLM